MFCATAEAQNPPVSWEQLVHRTHAERAVILNEYYERGITRFDSVTVFQHAHRLRELGEKHGDPELAYEADLIIAHYYFHSQHIPDQRVVDTLENYLKKAKDEDVLWMRFRMESILGHFKLIRLKEYEKALLHLAKAADLLEPVSAKNFPLKQICNFHIGIALYNFNDYKSALAYLRRAATIEGIEGMTDYRVNVVNTIGLIYRDQNKLDSSDYFFRKALAMAKEREHEIWAAIVMGNLGQNHYLKGNYEKALPLLRHDADMAVKNKDWGLASNALTLLGDIFLIHGQVDSSDYYIQLAHSCAKRSGQRQRLKFLYPRLAKLKAAQGESAEAAMYIDSSLIVAENIEREERNMLMSRSQQKLEHEKHLDRVNRLELEKEKKVLERNTLLAIVLAVVAFGLLLLNSLWSKYQLNRKRLKENIEELKKAKQGLYEITESLAERNLEIERLSLQAAEVTTSAKVEMKEKTILTQEDWDDFQELFEKVFPGFLDRLHKKAPDLTEAETRFIALKKLQLSNTKIAHVLGVGSGAIRQYRYRIRKKRGLSTAENLQTYIDQI
jgi:TPR repeat protein/DNA-binding CsgD family transcriptional regulator